MKTCARCKQLKPFGEFYPRTDRPGGYMPRCKTCKAEGAAAYRAANQHDTRRRSREWHAANRERSTANTLAWQAANREANLARMREYKRENAASVRQQWREWRDANRHVVRELKMRRRAALASAVPVWADRRAIRDVYAQAVKLSAQTGTPYTVDHIVPLQSDIVCGLHVEHNLRPMPFLENCSKGNRWWPDMPEGGE